MTGTSSIGTVVEIGEADEDYFDLGCTVDADLPGGDTQFTEDKCLGQATRHVTSIPTWIQMGEMSLTLKYGQDAYEQLLGWQEDQPRLYLKLTFPKQYTDAGVLQATAAYAKFRVYVKQARVNFDAEGNRVQIALTVKVDSAIDFTPGTSIS